MATDHYTNTSEDTIDGDEMVLYNLIMEYRASVGLDAIPLSKGLTAVAGRHVLDTVYNTGAYQGHSWSDAVYDKTDSSTYPVIWDAPTRLGTGYTDTGYEISTGFTSPLQWMMTPERALGNWQSSAPHNAVIINQSPWVSDWKAIGVGIHKGISHVWFGHETDPQGEPVVDLSVADSGQETPPNLPPANNDDNNGGNTDVATDADNSPYEIYRFYNTQTDAHFFTTSVEERDLVIATTPTMIYEGNAFDSNATPDNGGNAVARFYNTQTGVHFYTASEEEAGLVRDTMPQFIDEGIVYYADLDGDNGGTPLYRFLNTQTGNHFYTASDDERDHTIDTIGHFQYEGIAYYVDVA